MLPQELLTRLTRARCSLRDLDVEATIAELARASDLSRSQFMLRYRTAFGETPHQTRIGARLERARWLLATTDLSVTDICMTVRFASLGTFSRTFRARCGEPPIRFRARVGGAGDARARLAPHCLALLAAA